MSRKRRNTEVDRISKIPLPKSIASSAATSAVPLQIPATATMDAVQQQNAIIGSALDAFQNVLNRTGYGTPNLTESTDYINTRLTRNFMLLTTLYRSHWIIRKIIDLAPEDMCKNWFQLASSVTPEEIDRYQKVERRTKTKASIIQSLKWGRLYGGAAAVMLIKGHEDYLDQPLDYETIMPGSYCGLLVLDRWSGISPSSEYIQDINSPDFGLPASYRVTTQQGQYYDVHSSRVLRFPGRSLPAWEAQAEMMWGVSEVELVFDELKKRDNASFNTAALIYGANIKVLKMPELRQMLSSTNRNAQQKFYNSIAALNHIMSSQGMLVLDEKDEFDTKQYTFTGISEVLQIFMLDVSGAAEIPVTKLFGRSPAGMNATGESDLQNYYDGIEQKQETSLRPPVEKLLPVMAMSTWGYIPDDLDFTFNTPQTAPSEKLADLASKKSSSVLEAYNAGLISQRTSLKELRQMSDETGMWTNITDEDIARADDNAQPQGEMGMPGMEGMMLGAEGQQPPGSEPPTGDMQPGADPKPRKGPLQLIREARQFISAYLGRFTRDASADFSEADHPRDEDGKFGSGGGGSSKMTGTKIVEGKRVKSDGSPLPSHIQKLKIPPAWTDVEYSDNPDSDLLAKGRDSKGRLQACYSEKFQKTQAAAKFERIEELNQKFDAIKAQNENARKDPTKDRADCMKLIMTTGIRPGSDRDTSAKVKAYGATTLEGKHVVVDGDKVTLQFVGKKGVNLSIPVEDPDTAQMLIERKKQSGDDGRLFATDHAALLGYTHSLNGHEFKTKDFRTLLGTQTASSIASGMKPPTNEKDYRKAVMDVAKQVSKKLGNTPTIALQSYINPSVFSIWERV